MLKQQAAKALIFLLSLCLVIATSFVFAVLHHDDGDRRIAFELTNHHGVTVSEKHFAGKYLLVFFGFTSCARICPVQMSKLSGVMDRLEKTGDSERVQPLFVSVDPERDSVSAVANYVTRFNERFVGLTGSRQALAFVADRFDTLLGTVPSNARPGYQLTHSSVVYIVNPSSELIGYVGFDDSTIDMERKIRALFL